MKRNSGFALFTVLVMVGLLTLMLGAFTQLNRQYFGLMSNDQSHVAAEEAARSVLDYCTYRLEHHRQWGATPFNGATDSEVAGYLEVTEVEDTYRVEGRVVQSGAEFDVHVLNNIDGSGERDGVAKGDCRLRISASRGASTVRRELLLATAPLFDSAGIGNQFIDMSDAETVTIKSEDRLRNRLRSKGDIRLPTYEGNRFRFDNHPDATERGLLWAERGIDLGTHDLTDPDEAAEAARRTGGRYFANAETHFEIYDLQLDEVKSAQTDYTVQSGIYVFTRRDMTFQRPDGSTGTWQVPFLERRDWAVNDEGQVDTNGGVVREAWYLNSALPDGAVPTGGGLEDVPPGSLHGKDTNQFSLDTGVHVHFNDLDPDWVGEEHEPPSVILNSDINLNVTGDFGIVSDDPRYNPKIVFRDPESGAVYTEGGAIESGSITTHASGDGRPGSIFIQGSIIGNGKLLAEGDVTLRNTFAAVSSDTQSDLSIYAGGSVKIKPPRTSWFEEEAVFNEGWLAGQDGVTAFRGLIFAQEDVYIETHRGDAEGRSDLYIEGAVVARNGNLKVEGARNVTLNYNPIFLDTILDPNFEDRVRLERVVYREF